jgi:hypothetical protein
LQEARNGRTVSKVLKKSDKKVIRKVLKNAICKESKNCERDFVSVRLRETLRDGKRK